MSKQTPTTDTQSDKKERPKTELAPIPEVAGELAGLAQLPGGPISAAGDGSVQSQAAQLRNPRLQTAQRQALAAQIGRMHGNRHLQRVIASLPVDHAQRSQPELAENVPLKPSGRETHLPRYSLPKTSVETVPLKLSGRATAPVIQRGFFGSLWEGIKSVGSAIATGAKWVGERIGDAAMWVVNLIRDLPERLARLGQTLWEGLKGVVTFIPEGIKALASGGLRAFGDWLWEKAKSGGAWVLTVISRVFDTLGGPEIAEFITHMLTKATPLTGPEITAASSVLGPSAIRYEEVRIAEGGLLDLIFKFNQGRAFTTWHTLNMPSSGDHARTNLAIVVHELTHVYQYERAGSLYLGQAIHAQSTIGYGYGGAAGLTTDRATGKKYRDYNREQQAQIAQDYYTLKQSGGDATAYEPFITELQAGDL